MNSNETDLFDWVVYGFVYLIAIYIFFWVAIVLSVKIAQLANGASLDRKLRKYREAESRKEREGWKKREAELRNFLHPELRYKPRAKNYVGAMAIRLRSLLIRLKKRFGQKEVQLELPAVRRFNEEMVEKEFFKT